MSPEMKQPVTGRPSIGTPFILAAFAAFFAGVLSSGDTLQGSGALLLLGGAMAAVGDLLGLLVGGFLAIGVLRAVERHMRFRAERRAEILGAAVPKEDPAER